MLSYPLVYNSLICGRRYQGLCEQLEAEIAAFRMDAASRGLSRRQQHAYPNEILNDLPDFVDWLPSYTRQLVNMHGSRNVDIDMVRLSNLPSREAEIYQQMWAYGNHYRVYNEGDERGFVTQDYGIASIFGAEEGQSAGVNMVGVLKEIIVVRYSAQRRAVFRGSWIRNDPGAQSSTKVDQYGFTIVRYNDRIARNNEPYVLPATIRVAHLSKGMPETPRAQGGPRSDTRDLWRRW
jgi:hypothetical protein